MSVTAANIIKKADRLTARYHTRNPYQIAEERGITVLKRPFKKQKGAYKVILRNSFIFLKADLNPAMEQIVLLHEIGHDVLHRDEAIALGGFQEFNIFDMRDNRMEYEANLFAAQISLPDEDVLYYINQGYDIQQIAAAMNSDINLVALKADMLISSGYRLQKQEHRNDFLKESLLPSDIVTDHSFMEC